MILVTGGAGYIGSHTVHQLVERGEKVVVVDNLYSGFRWAVPPGVELVVADMGDRQAMAQVLKRTGAKEVIHFAAHLVVDESVREPMKYYRNNVLGVMNLVEECIANGVERFIFSSTCATYGTPASNPVTENFPTRPESPYGRSKLAAEFVLKDLAFALETAAKSAGKSAPFHYSVLRYFNVAGARKDLKLGQATPGATQLVKVAAEVAAGKRPIMKIFGTDYPTPDGTCIRDYIHVDDLADAHILALQYLRKGGTSETFNCGYGHGSSVLEVVNTMKKVTGIDFKVEVHPRRPGDPVAIFNDPTKTKKLLGWEPKLDNLELICRTSYDWEFALSKLTQPLN